MRVLMVAGEASGDAHAGKVAQHLIARGAEVLAVGGPQLQLAGARLIRHFDEFAVLGFVEVVQRLPRILALKRDLEARMQREHFDLFLPVDYPGLNLRLAKSAQRCGIPVLYYVGPQVWAWRAYRLQHLRRHAEHVALILPFEKKLYDEARIPATFVGHPLLEDVQPQVATCEYDLGLFPGSRIQEIRRHLPILLQTAQALQRQRTELRIVVSQATSALRGWMSDALMQHGFEPETTLSSMPAHQLMPRARALLVASGTATLEAALADRPFAVIYRTGRINYAVARRLVRVENVALVNLVASAKVVREYLQDEVAVPSLIEEVSRLLDDEGERKRILEGLAVVRSRLGQPGASQRVATLAETIVSRRDTGVRFS